MSFSSEIKEKLCMAELSCSAVAAAETAGAVRTAGIITEDMVRLSVPSEACALRLAQNIKTTYDAESAVGRKGNSFVLAFANKQEIYDVALSDDEECENAFLRGAFLCGGSVSDPEKSWHIEFDTYNKSEAEFIAELLGKREIRCGITERKNRYAVYSKDCDSIAAILGSIGAGADALQLFGIQVERRMRNDINRRINFESANLDKSIKAASKHIKAVKLLKAAGKWEKLPEVLKEIGELRVDNPDVSLKQLGEMLDTPIGKSGVNHRLNRLLEAAEGISTDCES